MLTTAWQTKTQCNTTAFITLFVFRLDKWLHKWMLTSHYPHRSIHTTKTIPNVKPLPQPLEVEEVEAYLPLESGSPPHLCVVSSSPLTTSANVRGELSWSWCSVSFLSPFIMAGAAGSPGEWRGFKKGGSCLTFTSSSTLPTRLMMNNEWDAAGTTYTITHSQRTRPCCPWSQSTSRATTKLQYSTAKWITKHAGQWIPRTSPRRVRPL